MFKFKTDISLDTIYKPETFEVKSSLPQECKLTEFEKENKRISVKISDEKLEKKGVFFQAKYSCKLTCPELETSVTRTMEDFIWFKNQLNEKYPLIYVPPLYTKEKLDDPKYTSRYLEKFFKAIIRKRILRTSPILQEFLSIDDNEKFLKYKEKLNENKFNLLLNLENMKSTKTVHKYEFKKEQIFMPEKYLKKIEPSKLLYTNLEQNVTQVANDFSNLTKHMKELSETLGNLYKSAKDNDQGGLTKKVYEKLKSIFNTWSGAYGKQAEFFDKDFKEFFVYLNLELNELTTIQKQFLKFRSNYETLASELKNKREKLFAEKKYAKWELKKEDEEKIDSFKDNHDEAMKYICKEFGEVVEQQKVQVAGGCNIVMKQFKQVAKYMGEQLKEYFEGLKDRNQDILGDSFNIVKLFNFQIEE